jgi:Integrase core domain
MSAAGARRPDSCTTAIAARSIFQCGTPTDSPTQGSRRPSAVAVIRTTVLAESIIGLFKTEVIRRKGPWRHLEAVELATLEWVDWFNHRQLLEPIGYVPPAEYEARYYEQAAVA